MSNTKEETIERLCKLVTKIGEHFEHRYAHDCFCHEADPNWDDFRCDDEVLDFIEEAVNEKLEEYQDSYTITISAVKQFNISDLQEVLDWAGTDVEFIAEEGELRTGNGHVKSGGWLVKDFNGKVYKLEMYGSV